MKGLACIVIFCLGAYLTEALRGLKECPKKVPSVKQFNMKRYEGLWYTQFRTPLKDHVNNCTTTLVDSHEDNGYFMRNYMMNNTKIPVFQRYVVYNDHRNGIFRTRLLGAEGYRTPINNWVVDTDYDTYSVRFSCYDKNSQNFQVISLQTRQQFPSMLLLTNLKLAAYTGGLSLKGVVRVSQKSCPDMVKEASKNNEEEDDDDDLL